MSYDIGLYYNDELATVALHTEGGTYVMSGSNDAELCITCNYSQLYYDHLNKDLGLKWLNGKQAKDTIERLEYAISQLGTEQNTKPFWLWEISKLKQIKRHPEFVDSDGDPVPSPWRNLSPGALETGIKLGYLCDGGSYWMSTPGNAGYALSILLSWAKQHPEATWKWD